jgi:formate dehydrogenase subunit gamma
MSALRVGNGATANGEAAAAAGFERYTFVERVAHWTVGLSFIALMLSGFALGYPRAFFLSGLFGGGQTMRFLHPWFGVLFTVGILYMLVAWWRDMKMTAVDKAWAKKMKDYAGTGHTGLDVGRYNAGQKGFYWVSMLLGIGLFVTGLPLWYPWMLGAGGLQNVARFVHHALFLLFVGGFIIHVYMSAIMFPGTMSAMTTGRVSRSWAAHHHPAWFRVQDRRKAGASH